MPSWLYFGETITLTGPSMPVLLCENMIDELPDISGDITFSPKVSIGINSGQMISGNIGFGGLAPAGLYRNR